YKMVSVNIFNSLEDGIENTALLQSTTLWYVMRGSDKAHSELEAIKARVREMEEEAEKLKQLQSEVDKQMNLGSPPGITSPLNMSTEEKMEVDNRSIYVGNVDYGATAEELEQHFHEKDSVQTAMAMDESLFRGRQIKVMPKRTNRPGMSMTNRPPRGRGYRGGRGRASSYYGYRPMRRPRGYRGRSSYYMPY
ncbi:hypothetical protein L9F63_027043, partial [Diploptera punctata]